MPALSTGCPFHNINHIREFDALDPSTRENPWSFYDWLRNDTDRAVYKLPHEKDFYLVHRYEDVKLVFADTENFSNKIIPTIQSPFLALMDGDEHERIRNVITLLFTQKNLLQWEPKINEVITRATKDLFENGKSELFNTWANAIPLGILATMFGLRTSTDSIQKLHADAIAINKALFVTGGTGPRRSSDPTFVEKINIAWTVLKNTRKLLRLRKLIGKQGMRYLGSMLKINDRKLTVPRPNFEHIPLAVSPMLDLMIVFAESLQTDENYSDNPSMDIFREAIKKGEVTLAEMIMAGAFILFAGYETTTSLLSNCFVHLCQHPALFRELKEHPDKIEAFIEESLRYYTPVGRFLRRTKKDVFISGTLIPKNSIVILMPGAANTDSVKFENGCEFNIARENNRQHLSFGKGAHFCVGAPLARMQVSIAIKELIKKAESISIADGSPMQIVSDRDNGILRYEELQVVVY